MTKISRVHQDVPGPKAPPAEFVGYENLIAFIKEQNLLTLEGDLIEIGAYIGGGTAKLAQLANQHGKKLYVIDTFDPALDQTVSKNAVSACDVYRAFLEGRSMWETYREATRHFDNIVTIRKDSRKVEFDEQQRFVFGFVDGCHQKTCVENDFNLVWPHVVPGGILGFHDYRFDDWPEVTEALTELMDRRSDDIGEAHEVLGSYGIKSILLKKR